MKRQKIGMQKHRSPVEIMTISEQAGVHMRATVKNLEVASNTFFVPAILDVLKLQAGIVLWFKYCDDNKLPLLDLEDLKGIKHATGNEPSLLEESYGRVFLIFYRNHIAQDYELE
jgi:hypothetical protein